MSLLRATLIRHTDGSVTLDGKSQPELREPFPSVPPISLADGHTLRCCCSESERLKHCLYVYDGELEALYGFGISRKGVYVFDENGFSFIPTEIPPPKPSKRPVRA